MPESVAKQYEEMHTLARKLAADDAAHFKDMSKPQKTNDKDMEYDMYLKHTLNMLAITGKVEVV